jgi:NAD(P)H-dependent flavin oxidoreductase YrpB (nitropropane dioxygenase family)
MAHHTIQTPITKLLGIKHPIILAGMNQASGPELAAAVSNAGGCARPASSSATL